MQGFNEGFDMRGHDNNKLFIKENRPMTGYSNINKSVNQFNSIIPHTF